MENGIYLTRKVENGITSVHIPEEVAEFARLNARVQERLTARNDQRRRASKARAKILQAYKAAGGWALTSALLALAGSLGLMARPLATLAATLALCTAAWRLGRIGGGNRP